MCPKVSVIVPVYGVEKYIKACAESLFGQTLDEIELIFINDCTKDKSIEILRDVLIRYPNRMKQTIIYNMPQNSGQALVRKTGILMASGEYIINCDSDDRIDLDCYEKLYLYAKANNADMVFHNYIRVTRNSITKVKNQGCWNNKKILLKQILSGNLKGSLCMTMIRRSLFINPSFIFPKGDMTEDFTMIVQLVVLSRKIGYLDEYPYYYYIHKNSLTNHISIKSCLKKFNDSVENVSCIEMFLSKMNVYLEDYIILERKIDVLNQLLPCLHKHSFLSLYRNTYKGIFRNVGFNPNIPIKIKMKFIIAYMGLYPIWHFIKGFRFAK